TQITDARAKVKLTNYSHNNPARATAHPQLGTLAAFPGTVLNTGRRWDSVAASVPSRIWRARKFIGAQCARLRASSGLSRTELRIAIRLTAVICATPDAQVYCSAI